MKKPHDVYYLVDTRLDSSLTGWSVNPFIVKTYYRFCVDKYQMGEDNIRIIKLFSRKELNVFIKNNFESLLGMEYITYGWHSMEAFVDALELQVCSVKSIGGYNKFAITTPWFFDYMISNGYLDSLIHDAHNFVHAVNYIISTLQIFLRGDIREQMEDQWSSILDYANLHVIRESYDCSAGDCNSDLQDKDFQMVRNTFLKSTGIDIVYDEHVECIGEYNGIFDQLTWMINAGLTIDWVD